MAFGNFNASSFGIFSTFLVLSRTTPRSSVHIENRLLEIPDYLISSQAGTNILRSNESYDRSAVLTCGLGSIDKDQQRIGGRLRKGYF